MSRNFERALLLLAGVLAGVFGVVLLRGGLPATRSVASLENQKRCAEQAQAFFRQVQQDDANWPDADLVQNRYDPASGVCFVRVSSYKTSDPVDQFRDEVADAFTGREYAIGMHVKLICSGLSVALLCINCQLSSLHRL